MENNNLGNESVFSKGFNTLEKEGGRYYVKMQFQNQADAYAAYRAIQGLQPAQPTTGYTAVDMTTAAAEGFRDGVSSASFSPLPKCRQRLAFEGKPYPRSSCEVCGQFSPKWRECGAIIAAGGKMKE